MSDEDDSVSSDGEQSESECGTRAPRLSEFGTSDSHAAEIQKYTYYIHIYNYIIIRCCCCSI